MTIGTDCRKAMTAHFMSAWGPPADIRERTPLRGSQFAVIQFSSRRMQGLRYATNGLASWPGAQADGSTTRCELYCATRVAVPWADALLDALARYPISQNTCFAPFDTVPVGRPIDRATSPFTAILMAPPGPLDPAELGAADCGHDAAVLVHRIVGLFQKELELAEERGSRELWERLVRAGEDLLIDAPRAPVA